MREMSIRSSRFWHNFFLRTCWYGGSTFDAWLNIASTKLAARLLTIPNATAAMGLPSAIVILLLQLAIGYWTSCIINILYLRHKKSLENSVNSGHSIQLHEIIGGLLGRRWLAVSGFFNIINFFSISALQLLACSNLVYFITDRLYKRTWILIFGALFSLSILTPTAHNYKLWSFLGVIAAVYASCYLTAAPLLYKERNATYTAPHSYAEYFNGVSGYIYFGHDSVSVEIMDAMWRPQDFKAVYFYSILYVLVVAMIPSLTVYMIYGDKTLVHPSALALFPTSKFYDITVILLLVHQSIVFGMFVLGIYLVWEKLLRVHNSPSYVTRTLSRVPIFLVIWLAALAFPFYGVINRVLDSGVVTWNLYIIPCAAYNAVFWSPSSRVHGDRPFSRIGWVTDFSVNLGIILWVVIVESGLGLWSGLDKFTKVNSYKIFAKCYAC